MSLRRGIAALLEAERAVPSWLALPGGSSPVRRLAIPVGLAVVGVGGSTLGGSGRTPVAIAITRALAARGHRVAFVAHGYGARAFGPRVVLATDRARDVGDEATIAASELVGVATVVVTRDRALALDAASQIAEVAIVDRLLQTAPVRVACSVLALDARRPWGSGRLVPFGDLVAPPRSLVAAADEQVRVGHPEAVGIVSVDGEEVGRSALLTSIARPDRVADTLVALGRRPVLHVKRGDHEPFGRRELAALRRLAGEHRLDSWWADAKTVAWLRDASAFDALGAPVRAIRHQIELAPALVDRIERRIRASIPRR
jgi:tetraacyldisaccharide 4'-kinase